MKLFNGFNTSFANDLTSGRGRSKGIALSGYSAKAKSAFGNIINPSDVSIYLGLEDAPGSTNAENPVGTNPAFINGVALNENGIFKKGASLDGSNQGVGYPLGTFPYSRSNDNDYSLSLWVNVDEYPNPADPNYNGIDATSYIVCNTNVPFGGRQGFVLLMASATSGYGVDGAVVYQPYHGATPFGAGTGFRNTNEEFLLQKNKWSHIAVNRSTVSGVEIWINGKLAVSDPFNQTSATSANGDITIGNRGTSIVDGGSFYNRNALQGKVDEFFLIDRTLTQEEIQNIYALGSNP